MKIIKKDYEFFVLPLHRYISFIRKALYIIVQKFLDFYIKIYYIRNRRMNIYEKD